MNQSTSKTVNAANVCRRLAALLATLALLASMTLPVYAEALENAATADDTQTTASEVVAEEPTASEDETVSDTTGAGETTDNAANTTEDDNSGDNDETPADDVTTPDAPAEDATQSDADDVDDNDASDTVDTITPVDSTDTTPDQDTEEAEEDSLADTLATQATSGIRCIVYFAVPKDWENEGYTTEADHIIYLNVKYQANPEKWKQFPMEDSGFIAQNGCKIYQATVEREYCPYEGFDTIQFQKYIGGNYQDQIVAASKYRKMTPADDSDIGDFYVDNQWSTYTPDYSNHTRLGGQKMVFENKTNEALTNVTAHFYEPDGNGDLVEVENGSVPLGNIAANGKYEFSIPTAACSYVRFTTGDETAISKYYNFYGQAVDGDDKGSFKYFANKTYAYIYNGSDASMWGVPGTTRVYYDATFSKLATTSTNDTGGDFSIPSSGSDTIYYRIMGTGKDSKSGTLVKDTSNENLYYVDVPEGYEKIVFSAAAVSSDNQTYGKGKSTAWLTIPTDDKNCYYADTNDAVVYSDNTRDGYWAPVNTLRDAETWKNKDVVVIKSDTFTADSKTKYVDSTLYDYYTDYELNGTARSTYETNFSQYGFESHRNWMPFRQFNQALSSYYEDEDVNAGYPIYTGHFQPKYGDWKYPFDEIASALNLYGYSDINRFMAVNNSTLNENGNQEYYDFAYQGLVASQTSTKTSAGEPLLMGTTAIEPHFNEAFLEGENSKNAKLGEVYKNVKFPFTKKQIFNNDEGVDYWYFDSQDTTLYLKQDAKNGYFLKPDTSNRESSQNLDAGSKEKTITNASNQTVASYGYFPFNETAVSGCASTYNYGFGTKLQLDFTLTDDGMVETSKTDSNGNPVKTNIKFFFSGDDDVWVFIDGQLALDVGGAHGKVSGLLEFGQTDDGTQNNVTAYVSQVKMGGTSEKDQSGNVIKSVKYNGQTVNFCAQGGTRTFDKGKTHTLTMYYMERGMWESNMAVAFNFPDHNELEVEKKVDTADVNNLFKAFYTDADNTQFTFNIKNLATHYDTVKAAGSTVTPLNLKVTDYTPSAWTGNTCAAVTNPTDQDSGIDVIQWNARLTDTSSDWRERRYGTLALNNTQDIANKQYLSFWMYCDDNNTTGYSLDRIYLQLVDSSGKTLGGDKQYIGSAVYGNVSLTKGKWCKVTLDLGKLTNNDFDSKNLAKIRFGCDYDRCIYWKDFTFTGTAASSTTVGFVKDQSSIPDYGSVAEGTLQNATGALYTSNARTGNFAVDADGEFVLKNNETIRFEDQFRRGSYLSITETPNDSYETYWTVYENGSPVTGMGTGNTVANGSVTSLEGVKGYAPDDGRTEKTDKNTVSGSYDGKKPNAETLVFRSYANPDSGDEGTLTKLKVQFVNKVKVGSLTIKKEGAVKSDNADNLTGEYKFEIIFSNIGGTGSATTVTKDVTLKYGETETINGIPLNTDYTITEVLPNDNSRLAEITINGTPVSGDTAKGTITGTSDANKVKVVFKNTKKPLIDLTVKKLWNNEQGTDLTEGLPNSIFLQLQRRAANDDDGDWTPVPNQSGSQSYVELAPDYDGNWQYTFTALDKVVSYEDNNTTNWQYRVVEGTVKGGVFTPSGNTITFGTGTDQKQFTISSSAAADQGSEATTPEDGTISGGNGTITLTNTLQDPRFNLKVIKADAENTNTKLPNVEFKLEKLKTDDNNNLVVDESFTPITGTTDGNGNLLVTKGDQSVEGFTELEAGIYQLTEIKAADGYNLLSGPIKIEFTKDGKCYLNGSEITVSTDGKETEFEKNTNDGSYTLTLTVLNRKVPELPHTGADAPSLWLLIGLPLAVAGLLVLVFRYNKKGGRTK